MTHEAGGPGGIVARGVHKAYLTGTTRIDVLKGVDLDVRAGEMVAIVGASGVGKSSLLHVLGGLDAFDAGTIRLGHADIHALTDEARVRFRNRHVGFVFQFHHLLPEFTAIENVEMPLRIAGCRAAPATGRQPFPEASSSALPSPAPWWRGRRCCWLMNPRATWTKGRRQSCIG
jgi:ABC-type lipoprotein export system ATPase subunit